MSRSQPIHYMDGFGFLAKCLQVFERNQARSLGTLGVRDVVCKDCLCA